MSETKGRTKAEIYKLGSTLRGREVSESQLIRSMAGYEKKLTANAEKDFADKLKMEKSRAAFYKPIRDIITKDKRAMESIKAMKQLAVRKQPGIILPYTPDETPRIYTGSVGVKTVPPYGYGRTWILTKGNPYIYNLDSNKKKGSLKLGLGSHLDDFNAARAKASVGTYFYPAVENGILRVRSNISYSYKWHTVCYDYTGESEGWVGLKIDCYNHSSKQYSHTIIKQKKYLFKDSSWWTGGSGEGSSSGLDLSAEIDVDSAHYYIIWVRCGARIFGDDRDFFGSYAIAELSVKVPSINLELS